MRNEKATGATRDEPQRRFLAQHRVQMLEQYCNNIAAIRNNVTTML